MQNNSLKVAHVLAIVCCTLAANSFSGKSAPIIKEIQNKDTIRVIAESESLFMKGKSLYDKQEYTKAIDYFLKSDSVISAHYGTDCPYYGYGEKWTASCYHKLGLDSIALEYSIYYDKQPIDKLLTHSSDSIIWIALRMLDLGKIKNAAEILSEAALLEKQELGPNSYWYANTLSVCSGLYSDIGDFKKAIEMGEESVEIYKKTFGADHPNYATCLSNLASCYADYGNCYKAIQLGLESLEIEKRMIGTEHPNYADGLSNLAEAYAEVGDYSDALRFGTEAMNIRKKLFGTEHSDYAISLICLSEYYSALGNYSEALRLGTEAMKIWKRYFGPSDSNYATSLYYLAIYYRGVGNYVKALQTGTEAMEIRKQILGNDDPHYVTSLGTVAVFNSDIGNHNDAIRIGKESLVLGEKVFGIGHPNYFSLLRGLARIYLNLGNYKEAFFYYKQLVACSQPYVRNHFVELSSNLRKTLWDNEFSSDYLNIFPCIVSKCEDKESISQLYDMTCLFAKGLLLNTDIGMRNLILESCDSSLITKYNNLSSNISIYDKLKETPNDKRFINADSLNNVIKRQEMELARDSKVYGDYTHNLTIKWKDVQRGLNENEIAIEFLDFPIYNTDSTMYIALTLKKGYDSPHLVTLFEKNQLKTISEDDYYTQTVVSNLVWKPLKNELNGVMNIYFVPSGELHRIGIEYLPINMTESISDVYTLHRLSSTRQLAIIQDKTEGKNSILYGGINYDEKESAISTDFNSVERAVLRSALSRANVDSLSLRSSFEYLEGTKRETDLIAKEMTHYRVPYTYYHDTEGTEESFKKLDGTRPKVMHIATHGFYLTEVEAEKSKTDRLGMELMSDGFQKISQFVEDKPMTRSGLLFSGCNRAFRHERIPDGEEDGILTAQEISSIDLRGLDLVVLSACQTGLGDVVSGEGVFGLQRGFKKAGANTILMSLNKVDDEATKILMVEFYRNLMNGKTKHQSLQDAQKYLRIVDNGKYDDPKYWASFVLLDGLN